MTESMSDFQRNRRRELEDGAKPATAVPTAGKGSRGNTAHLNTETPLAPLPVKRSYHRRIDRSVYVENQRKRREAARRRRPMAEYIQKRINRAAKVKATLIELASLGLTKTQISNLLKASSATVWKWCKVHKIEVTRYPETRLRAAVRQWYGIKTPDEISEMTGCKRGSVKVVACELGLAGRRDPAKFKRGFAIPDDRFAEYMSIRHELHNMITPTETAISMGILPRPEAHA